MKNKEPEDIILLILLTILTIAALGLTILLFYTVLTKGITS